MLTMTQKLGCFSCFILHDIGCFLINQGEKFASSLRSMYSTHETGGYPYIFYQWCINFIENCILKQVYNSCFFKEIHSTALCKWHRSEIKSGLFFFLSWQNKLCFQRYRQFLWSLTIFDDISSPQQNTFDMSWSDGDM